MFLYKRPLKNGVISNHTFPPAVTSRPVAVDTSLTWMSWATSPFTCKINIQVKIHCGSRRGTVVIHCSASCPPTICGPGSIPGPGVICGLSLLLILSKLHFSLGTLVFPSPEKPTFLNSNLIQNPRVTGLSVARLLGATLVKQVNLVISFYFTCCTRVKFAFKKKDGSLTLTPFQYLV